MQGSGHVLVSLFISKVQRQFLIRGSQHSSSLQFWFAHFYNTLYANSELEYAIYILRTMFIALSNLHTVHTPSEEKISWCVSSQPHNFHIFTHGHSLIEQGVNLWTWTSYMYIASILDTECKDCNPMRVYCIFQASVFLLRVHLLIKWPDYFLADILDGCGPPGLPWQSQSKDS